VIDESLSSQSNCWMDNEGSKLLTNGTASVLRKEFKYDGEHVLTLFLLN
jgi:hypothetical protein